MKDFCLPRAGSMVHKRSTTLVFLSLDSGEEYITVDRNQGNRYVVIEELESQRTLIPDFLSFFFAETS